MKIIDIANLIINKCLEQNINNLSITKLHKLLYIVYGTYLAIYDKPISDENPSCFAYGPIFKSIQQKYKTEGINFKDQQNIDTDNIDSNEKYSIDIIINKAIKKFGLYSANELSKWSHRDGSAWSKAYKETPYWGNKIDNKYIKEEFDKIIIKN